MRAFFKSYHKNGSVSPKQKLSSNDKSYLTPVTQPEALSLQISSDLSYLLRNLRDKKKTQKHLTIVSNYLHWYFCTMWILRTLSIQVLLDTTIKPSYQFSPGQTFELCFENEHKECFICELNLESDKYFLYAFGV